MAETYKATLDGGILVCKPGSLPSIAAQCRRYLMEGRAVYIRLKHQDYLVVTLRGFPPEAVAHNWVGDQVDLPPWTASVLNYMNN